MEMYEHARKKKNNNVYAEDSGGEENSLTTKHITEGCQIG